MKYTIKRNYIKEKNYVFLFAWSIYVISYIFLSQSDVQLLVPRSGTVLKLCELLSISVILLKIVVMDKTINKKTIPMLSVLIISAVSALISDSYHIFIVIAFAYGLKDIDIRRFIKLNCFLKIILIAAIVGLCMIGVLDNYVIIAGGVIKSAVGFYHPNILGAIVVSVLIELLYLYFEKNFFLLGTVFFVTLYILSEVCASRSSLIGAVLVFALFALLKLFPKLSINNKLLKTAILWLVPICMALSFFAAIMYNAYDPTWLRLNDILTNRIKWGSIYVKQFGMPLLGQKVNFIGTRSASINSTSSMILDNSYLKIGVVYGSIILILFCLGYCIFIRHLLRNNNYKLILLVVYYVILGLGENYLYLPAYNITLILMAASFCGYYIDHSPSEVPQSDES